MHIRRWFLQSLTLSLLGTLLLTACSSDPQKAKLKYFRAGEASFRSGRYQEAVIHFRRAIQADPRYAAAHYELGRAYLTLGNTEAAHRETNEAVSLDPNNREARLQLADLQLRRGQFDQVESAVARILVEDPANTGAHALLGRMYTLRQDFPRAIQQLQALVKLEPKRPENYGALGAVYLAAGQSSEAEATYKRAVEADHASAQARMALSQFYFSQRRMAEAAAEMRAACELDARAVAPRLYLARIHLASGRLTDAEDVYKALKSVAPDDPQAYLSLGSFYRAAGQLEKAASEFRTTVAAKPKDRTAKAYLVETLLDLNRAHEAAPLNADLAKDTPNDPPVLVATGRVLLAGRQYEKAAAAIEKALQGDPRSATGHYFLGVARRALGAPDLAKAAFARALELEPQMAAASAALSALTADNAEALKLAGNALKANPNLPSAHLASAQALIAKGDLPQAESVLQDLLRRDPTSLPALTTLLSLSTRQGRVRDVVQRLSDLVRQNPQNAGLHFLLATGYFELKDLANSERSVAQALSLDPKTPSAYTLLAYLELARGAPEKAKAHLRAAIAAQPRSLSNYMLLVTQYEREENWTEARSWCEKAHQVDPTAPMVAAELAFLHLEHGGDLNTAVALAQTAKQRLPDSPVAADTLGWAYYKLGSTDAAIAQLKEATQKLPSNPVYHYHLGMAYLAARKMDLAGQSLETALRTDPKFRYAAKARETLGKLAGIPRSRSGS